MMTIHRKYYVPGILLGTCLLSNRAAGEDFKTMVARLQQEKAEFAKRHSALLAARYDLADQPADGVTMSRGKPIQQGIRVKLPKGVTWQQLGAMKPAEIKARDLWPEGFFPLPHPHQRPHGFG